MDHPSLASAQKGAEKVLASTKSIHSEILAHAAALSDQNGARKMHTEGSVFDIFETTNGNMQRLEIDPFGAMPGVARAYFNGSTTRRCCMV
jgi:hypothetical protein